MANILLAEDDTSMRDFLKIALQKAGHSVTAFSDGNEALQALQAGPDASYDLLLTDIVMPGMDGIELSQKATDLCPKLKVMFITGFAAVAMRHQGTQKSNAKVLSKPFHLNDLVNQVENILKAA